MPKVEIDYSNTIFYKIYCVNPDITDMYIGHTTNFVQRKHAHKQSCTNNKCLGYTCKLYNYIREHGGWNNWIMEIIAFHNCEDHYSARMREQEYFKENNATLNSIEPLPPPKIKKGIKEKLKKVQLYCNTCNISFTTTTLHELHNKTNKHIKRLNLELIENDLQMSTIKTPKNADKLICENCNFKCSKQSEFNRHKMTAKHKNQQNQHEKTQKTPHHHACECGKIYKERTGLWRHKTKCTYVDDNDIIDDSQTIIEPTSDANTVLLLLKQNQEFKTLMVEQYEKNQELQQQLVDAVKNNKGNITNNNNTTNNNNQKFNLNFFLNDTCKDAMNITDFLGNIDVNVDELEYIGNHGYVNGMTKMIMERLKGMDITKRPIHCTDVKRETMYIKDKDEWCKDTDELVKLRRILSNISMSNYRSVANWRTAHPDSEVMDSRNYNFCYKMMRAILGDAEEEQIRLDNKIIKTFAKDLFVNKNMK